MNFEIQHGEPYPGAWAVENLSPCVNGQVENARPSTAPSGGLAKPATSDRMPTTLEHSANKLSNGQIEAMNSAKRLAPNHLQR
jgi:hypothetical protein